jgi:hypothetical protein
VNLILYYGVLAPRAGWRAALVPAISREVDTRDGDAAEDGDARGAQRSRPGAYQWAELMRRTFGLDVLACPRCGGRLRLVALIDQAPVIQRIRGQPVTRDSAVDHSAAFSIYFSDPYGHRLELTTYQYEQAKKLLGR